jgi:predicted permease
MGSTNWSVDLADRAEPEHVTIAAVSSSFFPVVGTAPQIGRGLDAGDDAGSPPRALVLSDALWTRRFGRDPGVVGRALPVRLTATGPPASMVVTGVMPAGFDFPRGAEAWVPAAPLVRIYGVAYHLDAEQAIGALGVFYGLARLRPHLAIDAAAADLTRAMRTATLGDGLEGPERVVVTPVTDYLLGPADPVLRTVFAGSALMLLIACANVAGLQVSRAARRRHALAIQAAMGASRRQLAMPVLAESTLITLAALVAAALVGWLGLRGLLAPAPAGLFRLEQATLLAARVLAFGAAVTFVTVALCAWWPIQVTRRADPVTALGRGGPRTTDGRRLQRGIVVGQLAVALTLLAGTGLFLRTVRGLDATVLGFAPDRLLAFTLSPPGDDPVRWQAVYDAVIRRLTGTPDVRGAAGVLIRPLSGPIGLDMQPILGGQVPSQPRTWNLNPHVNRESITPDYFRTMGIALRRGRSFDDRDTVAAPGAVIVSESAARRLWPGRDPIGQQLVEPTWRGKAPAGAAPRWQTVVGVVADVRYRGLADLRLDAYVPAAQSESRPQQLVVRAAGDVAAAVAAVRAAVREVDPAATVSDAAHMREVVAAESAPWRFLMQVFVGFASLAGLLATIGLAAIVALDVTTRRRELAIRAAVGADARRLRALILRDALALTGAGVALGLAGAFVLGRSVAHVLIGVRPDDPATLTAVAAIAACTGLAAGWLPAIRAGRADPVEALKAD